MGVNRALRFATWLALAMGGLLASCAPEDADWPPPPRSGEEAALIQSARTAVAQFDGWTNTLFVVERREDGWRVQAWRIVHPEARGRNRCAPWAVRGIHFDGRGTLVAYTNHI